MRSVEDNKKPSQAMAVASEERGSFLKTNVTTYQVKHDVCSLLTLNIAISTDAPHLYYENEILTSVENMLEEKFNFSIQNDEIEMSMALENKNTIDAATKVVKNEYEETFKNGSKIQFGLHAEIESFDAKDVEKILSFIAQTPRQFYLEVAGALDYEEIMNKRHKETTETKQLSSEQLADLKDTEIALLLYYLIYNSTGKSSEQIELIGKILSGFAVQLDKFQ